jgi:hypothetical protein
MSKPLPPAISEAELGYATYERLRAESRRGSTQEASPYTPSTAQGWVLRRGWTGEEYFVPGKPPIELLGDGKVEREYDPLRGFKRD